MSSHFRITDVVGRMGGEEFGVLLPSTDKEGVWKAAEHFRKAVARQQIPYGDYRIGITLSIGTATSHMSVNSFQAMLQLADKALYHSKENGRNRTTMGTGF